MRRILAQHLRSGLRKLRAERTTTRLLCPPATLLALSLAMSACPADIEGDEPGECSDDADNDGDGLFDCNDPDCAGAAACSEGDDDVADDDDSGQPDDDDSGQPDDDDSAGDDDDVAPDDDDDVADDDDTTDSCAAAVPCTGNYNIEDSIDLDQIALCESITGDLEIAGQGWLTNIDLPCLTSVDGDLNIQENDSLTDISGLSNLTSVGGDLWIAGNDALTDISGLSSLTSVGVALYIYNNPSLCQSLVDAFVAACTTGGSVYISGNDDGC